ncbi:MAG TPA: hypothetical protein P5550_01490 [Bacteroidales bacterium]|nr:hypothetical protein [Bacteroidales bacterium]
MLRKYRTWLLLLLVAVLAGAVIAYRMYNKPHPDYTMMEPEHTLSVSSIYEAFMNDAQAANALYTGKVVQLSGTLTRVEALDTTSLLVFALEEGMFGEQGVRATLHPEHAAEATGLTDGLSISIKGYCTGFNDTDVILEKCVVVK